MRNVQEKQCLSRRDQGTDAVMDQAAGFRELCSRAWSPYRRRARQSDAQVSCFKNDFGS
ncbi:hypothetical protein ACFV99_12750 [Streptomyces sp. NPDC059944]|uniref:hypothetical protein n=1 Tax=unclassified Streptomyces TaxID=2593676 RepID=UPI003646D51A